MNKKYEVAVNLQQDFTQEEQTQGRANIGAASAADLEAAQDGWQSGFTPKGEATVSQIDALTTQSNGDQYIVTDSGTITAGSVAVVAGDTVAWNATGEVWYKVPQYVKASDVAEMMARLEEVVAAALDDLDARIRAIEEAVSAVNLGERIADRLDVQTLLVGGEDVTERLNNL